MPLTRLWRDWRDQRALQRRAVPDALWHETLAALPFVACRPDDQRAELRRLSSLFLDRKEFTGAGGLVVTDAMAVSVAVQACLPILALGLQAYDRFVGIVIHPDEVVAPREVTDEDGVVHRYDEVLAGEAMEGGPLVLSWPDVDAAGDAADWGYNVVIHEFTHVLDQGGGMPQMPDAAHARAWMSIMETEYEAFRAAVDRGDDTLLDPYGAEAPEEFFAVASEAFFVMPLPVRDEHPALYALFSGYFRQDPAAYR
ncbi:MAG: zinc-dependent peptidase [Aquabacterium sp.]